MKKKIISFLTVLMLLCVGLSAACSDGKITLKTPEISLNQNVVSWVAVENAVGYEITVNGAVKTTVTQTYYTITETTIGDYVVTVKAISSNTNKYDSSAKSNSVTYSIPAKLAAPTLSIDGKVISWSAVYGAQGYDIYLNGVIHDTTTETSYQLNGLAIGSYSVTVVAKASINGQEDSDQSNAVNYSEVKTFVRIEKLTDPTKTVYYLDEAGELDLTGMTVKAVFANSADESVTLTADNVISEYDLSVVGAYQLIFEYVGDNNVSSTIEVTIEVKEASLEDVTSYTTIINEYSDSATSYKVSDSVATSVVDMKGNEITFAEKDGATYAEVSEGEQLIKVDGNYVKVIVARYVRTVDDFNAINQKLDGYYILMNNLDFTDLKCSAIGKAPIVTNAAEDDLIIDATGASGNAFTGTFDGNGYVIRNFKLDKSGIAWNALEGRGVALFGYVGETGVVRNLTLRDVTIKGMNHVAFVAGYNQGTIENISVESDCVLFSNYGAGAVVSAFNYGTVKNVVSLVSTLEKVDGTNVDINVIQKGDGTAATAGENGYVGNTTDLTAILGEGWIYIDGYGTVYGNETYKKVVSAPTTVTNGGQIEITIYQAQWADPSVAVWGATGYASDEVLRYAGLTKINDNLYVFTFAVKDEVTLTVDASLVAGVTATGGYFDTFNLTVIEASAPTE